MKSDNMDAYLESPKSLRLYAAAFGTAKWRMQIHGRRGPMYYMEIWLS